MYATDNCIVRSVRSKIYGNRDKTRKSTKLGTIVVWDITNHFRRDATKIPPGGEGRGIFVNATPPYGFLLIRVQRNMFTSGKIPSTCY